MKVIHNQQNMMIQEFQHCMEFQLIEEMNMKMQKIQFVSIVNLLQMKSMKVIDICRNMMIQEVWHHEESQSSEVTNPQMQMIQFGSNMIWIQTKLIEFVAGLHNNLLVKQELTEESIPEQTQYRWDWKPTHFGLNLSEQPFVEGRTMSLCL
jgi:hypothetical protein